MTDSSRTAPFGSWPSPLSIDAALAGEAGAGGLCADGADLLWVETVPAQDGRCTLMRLREERLEELTPLPCDVRSRVNQYGGGEFHAAGGSVAWCDDHDNTVWLATPDGARHQIAAGGTRHHFGDLRVVPELPAVLAVREEERDDGGQAITTLVALPWPARRASAEPQTGEVLCEGADFYANPEAGPGGQIAWIEWNHPDMPWDATSLRVGELRLGSGHVTVRPTTVVAGRGAPGVMRDVSVQHPRWLPDRRLAFMSDESGFWNLNVWDGRTAAAVHKDLCDFDWPAWQLGNNVYAMLDDRHVLGSLCDEGVVFLATVDLSTGDVSRAASVAGVNGVAAVAGTGYALVTRPAARPALVRVTPEGTLRVVHTIGAAALPDCTSVPRSISFPGPAGEVQAWFYPPVGDGWRGPDGEKPPLVVRSHGGPTAFASDQWRASVQFWTSRGFAYLDVNYSGSSGFGRAYRNRLRGQWGVLDVEDCVAGVRAIVGAGLADPARVAISGGSAGGFTTLQALTSTDVFAAGVSSYGIGDLELLARDTHKFESRYTDGLVGPYPEAQAVFRERSPLHHLDRLRTPMLIMQGADDRVVPPEQATAMADAVRARGLPVALLMFEGEGHGFRKESSRRAALEAELSFYAQMFGFAPADPVPVLAIENLPATAGPVRARRASPITDQ
ncbi:MAG: prolyl oligopeptidase family serine peptidase [Actinomycetia bacterium]|nr:prolyl oligopeptidase family serine peptidase [Actinomycetes bacterium]